MSMSWTPWEHLASEATSSPGRERVQLLSRFSGRERRPAFWIALWTAAVAAELAVLRPALFARDTPVEGLEVVFACVGGSFAACGIVAWRRRPDSRSGALMTATGFAFFLPSLLGQIDSAAAATLGTWLVDLWSVLFVALLVSLLTAGRLETSVDRLLVFLFVLPLLILEFAWLLVAEEVEPNVLLAFPDKGVADVIDTTQRSILIGACLATVLVLGLRWRAATRPRRRALLPTIAGSFVLLIYTALLINDLASGERSVPLLWVASCALVTVPLAFLAGLLRSRLARSGLADLFRDLRNLDHAALQATLAKALGDPGLRLVHAGADGALPLPRRAAFGRAARARRPPLRRARLRPVARRRPGAGGGGLRGGVDRARERAPPGRVAGAARRAAWRRASGSSRPATPSAGGWSATSTTARSSGWSRSRCSCG